MSTDIDLLASYWTLAVGAEPHTGPEHSSVDFRTRVETAAKAGFKGIGIWHADLDYTLRTLSLKDMKRILDDNGIRHVELEFLLDWFLDGERKQQSDIQKQKLFTAAQALNARSIKVGDFFRTPCPMPKLIDSFATLCADAAANTAAKIGYEMMPFSIIDSLPAALELVQGAGAKNGGIFFDLWHIVKIGIPFDDVASFPKHYWAGVELNDGYIKSMANVHEETTQYRKLCGEGQFDVKGFVARLRNAGWPGPWGIEVLSGELRRRPIEEVAERAFRTTREQFQ
jgi:sugar phosphate isomerase/epimerase